MPLLPIIGYFVVSGLAIQLSTIPPKDIFLYMKMDKNVRFFWPSTKARFILVKIAEAEKIQITKEKTK